MHAYGGPSAILTAVCSRIRHAPLLGWLPALGHCSVCLWNRYRSCEDGFLLADTVHAPQF